MYSFLRYGALGVLCIWKFYFESFFLLGTVFTVRLVFQIDGVEGVYNRDASVLRRQGRVNGASRAGPTRRDSVACKAVLLAPETSWRTLERALRESRQKTILRATPPGTKSGIKIILFDRNTRSSER